MWDEPVPIGPLWIRITSHKFSMTLIRLGTSDLRNKMPGTTKCSLFTDYQVFEYVSKCIRPLIYS